MPVFLLQIGNQVVQRCGPCKCIVWLGSGAN